MSAKPQPQKIDITWLLVIGLSIIALALLIYLLVTSLPPLLDRKPDFVDLLEQDPEGRFTILLEAVEAAGLTDDLRSAKSLTGFCPTDAAFAKLAEDSKVDLEALLADPELLRAILPYHVAAGYMTATDLAQQETVVSLEGSAMTVRVDNDTIKFNNARATEVDINAANGIINVIDTVLLPVGPPAPPPPANLNPAIEVWQPYQKFQPLIPEVEAGELVPGHPVIRNAVQELSGVLTACRAQINTARAVRLAEGGETSYVAPVGSASAKAAECPNITAERILGVIVNQGEENFWVGPGPYLVVVRSEEPASGEFVVGFLDGNFDWVADFRAPLRDSQNSGGILSSAILYGTKWCKTGRFCWPCGGFGSFDASTGCIDPPPPSAIAPEILREGPLLPSSEGMVKIPTGSYSVGLDSPGENYIPPQQVTLTEFWIDQYEVTNFQYAEFLAATNHRPPANWPGQANHPVEGVTWNLAAAYCNSLGKRLPTEAEWEIAARGMESRLYPWGDDPKAVELPEDGSYPVGSIDANLSSFGLFDMAGNVWEWVGDPYEASLPADHRVLRGGAYGYLRDMAYRIHGDPNVPTMFATAGIRCAADQVPAPEEIVDDFTDPSSGWPTTDQAGLSRFGYHPPDFYHVEVSAPNRDITVFGGLNFDDFTLETEALVDQTNTQNGDFRYGLALRRSGDQYYAFAISPRSGTWQVLKSSPVGLEVLAEGTTDSLQGLVAPDTLRVDANGPNFTFAINGQDVTQVTDADYASGDVGFFVENFDESLAHIHYDSLTIRHN